LSTYEYIKGDEDNREEKGKRNKRGRNLTEDTFYKTNVGFKINCYNYIIAERERGINMLQPKFLHTQVNI